MDRQILIERLNEHRDGVFPEFPDDAAFADWVEELFEVDDYYFGLISSLIEGHAETIDLSHLENLKDGFKEITPDKTDQDIYDDCVIYLQSLSDLVESIASH